MTEIRYLWNGLHSCDGDQIFSISERGLELQLQIKAKDNQLKHNSSYSSGFDWTAYLSGAE